MKTNKIIKGYDLEDAKTLKFTIHNKHIIIMNIYILTNSGAFIKQQLQADAR